MEKMKFLFCHYYFCILLSISVIKHTSCINVIPEYYLDETATSNSACGDVIDSRSSVYLRSQVGAGLFGGLNHYEPNQDCETTLNTDTGYQILVQYEFFNLQEPSGNTCIDKLQLQENVTKEIDSTLEVLNVTMVNVTEVCNGTGVDETCWNVTSNYTVLVPHINITMVNVTEFCNGTGVDETCWNVTSNYTLQVPDNSTGFEWNTTEVCKDPEPFISSTNSLKIRFQSDGSVEGSGISLLVTEYHQPPCNDSIEFLCDTNRCIAKTLTCDGVNHCLDKTDETKEHASCSSIELIAGKVSGLGKNVVIGIVVISAGVICTVIIVVMMSQFMNKDSQSSCTRGDTDADDEESNIPRNVKTRKNDSEPSTSNKQKKSVTIMKMDRKEVPETRHKRARKVAPAKGPDNEW